MNLCALLFVALIHVAVAPSPAASPLAQVPLYPPDIVPVLLANWTRLAAETAAAAQQTNRTATVMRAAFAAAGIYVDVQRARMLGVERYVMLTLTAVTDNAYNPGAKMAKNWLCYTAHHGLKPLLYYIEDVAVKQSGAAGAGAGDGRAVAAFRALNTHAQFVTFPEHIFWGLLVHKTGWGGTATQGGVVDFRGPRPAFKRFGPFLKVVPLLEVSGERNFNNRARCVLRNHFPSTHAPSLCASAAGDPRLHGGIF